MLLLLMLLLADCRSWGELLVFHCSPQPPWHSHLVPISDLQARSRLPCYCASFTWSLPPTWVSWKMWPTAQHCILSKIFTRPIFVQKTSVLCSRDSTEKREKEEEGQRRDQVGRGPGGKHKGKHKGSRTVRRWELSIRKGRDGNTAGTKSIPVWNPGVSFQVWA